MHKQKIKISRVGGKNRVGRVTPINHFFFLGLRVKLLANTNISKYIWAESVKFYIKFGSQMHFTFLSYVNEVNVYVESYYDIGVPCKLLPPGQEDRASLFAVYTGIHNITWILYYMLFMSWDHYVISTFLRSESLKFCTSPWYIHNIHVLFCSLPATRIQKGIPSKYFQEWDFQMSHFISNIHN